LSLDLWVLSCRVLKREMERGLFAALVGACAARGIRFVEGLYVPSARNGLVADHYARLGFTRAEGDGGPSERWLFEVSAPYPDYPDCLRTGSAPAVAGDLTTAGAGP
jgi:predicted enzyme involved in methoxymalonyl-ACP biosynthesis